ncbi:MULTISPECIES: DUF3592 domain-containing protein [unclassified Streptomyces]|uniref:DUF3592 domain-containing protein n=1 Tax=unclassified Streptomyces TaxID=2593676 RepID=UPI0037893E63
MSLLGGVILLGFGTREATIQSRLRREGIRAGGLVIRHHRSSSGKVHGTVFFAVVEFVDALGSRHTFQAGSSGVKGLPVGSGVPVVYLAEAPKTARINLTRRGIGEVASLLAGGTLFTVIGIWMLATGR